MKNNVHKLLCCMLMLLFSLQTKSHDILFYFPSNSQPAASFTSYWQLDTQLAVPYLTGYSVEKCKLAILNGEDFNTSENKF